MRLRVKMAAVVIGMAGLLVPLAGVTGAQAASAWTTPTCVVKGVPYSFVEAGEGATQHSSIAFIIEVSCQPAYGESTVEINAHQLNNACHNTLTWAQPPGVPTPVPSDSFNVQLDDNGNANAVVWGGPSCAATTDLITADLTVPPYTTARTHVVIKPPADTTPGLTVYPKSLVEDSVTSSVAAIFYAEFPSYDSQQQVTFSDDQLYNQCHGNIYWYGSEEVLLSAGTKSASTTLDNNGNAFVIAIGGPSCASGHTLGQVELNAAPYTTYTHGFTVLSPRVRNP